MKLWRYYLSLLTSLILIHPIAASTIKEDGLMERKRVVSIVVAPLPGGFSKVKITLPNDYIIKVGQQGAVKALDPIIELSTPSKSKLSMWFDGEQAFKEATKIFSDITEGGDYQLQISFENYDPESSWKLTTRNKRLIQPSQKN